MALLTRLAAGAFAAALAASPLVRPAAAQTPGLLPTFEDEVKAAYLYNFTKFVDWPALAFRATSDPLVMCVAAHPSFSRAVERIITGEKVGGRSLRLVHATPENAAQCHVLFIGRGEDRAARLLAAVGTAPVLTVSDDPRFLGQGGIILFALENNRIRFDIDVTQAEAVGLRVSSKLLRVARRVLEKGSQR